MILDFQDKGAVVLTTPEPGAFLNIRWDPNGTHELDNPETIDLYPELIPDISAGVLWVNGIDISQEANIYDDASRGYQLRLSDSTTPGDPSTASFHIYTRELSDFETNLTIKATRPFPGVNETYDISILNRPHIISSDSINPYETSNVQVEGDTSYMMLRTNPKFSGNIKLNIDPSNNMFLDTFKVSDILSNKLYRKQQVSANSYFSGDVRKIFSSLPQGEMYRLDAEDTLNIAIPKTDIWKQYNLNYSYGAKLFQDELYPEDYSMLAPIWINNKLPDYFAIFRVPGVFNEETYSGSSLVDLAEKFLTQGELTESWGIKEGSPLGTYLRNHLKELTQVISPMFLSLSDPDKIINPDPNTWYGISTEKGIITGKSETTYFFDQKSDNFTDLNGYCSEGFERLNILCPNLINLEYGFNDTDVSLYTMNRYFGLYLTENPLYEISYYSKDPDSSVRIISLDGKDSQEFFDSSIFDIDGSIMDQYQNRLFTLDDLLSIKRIRNSNQVNGNEKNYIREWINKPGKNIFSEVVENINDLRPYISFKLKKRLQQGDTLRFIDKTDFKIYEIYGVETDILGAGESWTYASKSEQPGYPTVLRCTFSILGSIEDQINAIWKAWKVFENYPNPPFKGLVKRKDSMSLMLEEWAEDHRIHFQRLTSQTVDNPIAYDNLIEIPWEKKGWGEAVDMEYNNGLFSNYGHSSGNGNRTDYDLTDYTNIKSRNDKWTWIMTGLNTASFESGLRTNYTFDTSKSYMYAFWARSKDVVVSDTQGSGGDRHLYFGFDSAGLENTDNGSSNTNPYFAYTDSNNLEDDWFLYVGKINAQGTIYPDSDNLSGIYNTAGVKIYSGNDYTWRASLGSSHAGWFRIGLYEAKSGYVFIQEPQLYLMDGSEPSIEELLGLNSYLEPFNNVSHYNDVEFYGNFLPSEEDYIRRPYNDVFGPINFELYGDRLSLDIDIFDPRPFHLYSLDSSVSELFEDNMLYLAPDNWYRLVDYFDVSTATARSLRYSDDPTTIFNKALLPTEHSIVTVNEKYNAYSVYPLVISLMGINPVKDFDFTVYDSSILDYKSEYWYKREGDSSTYKFITNSQKELKIRNSYKILEGTGNIDINGSISSYNVSPGGNPFGFNTFNNNAIIYPDTSTLVSYSDIDSSAEFKSYKEGYSEESLNDYYQDPSLLLRYGLTVPTITKWQGIGNDCRNNPLRLLLNTDILDVSSNFIPYEDSFDGELFYPSFKYLDSGSRNWEDYIFFDINDSIEYVIDGSTFYGTFKEIMISNPYVDVFSKLVYSNNNVEGTKLRSSIVYYNNYKNTIDALFNGISFSFRIVESARNIIDIQDWDRYRISGIAVPSRNRDSKSPMEVFINENTETILLVWYQGNDILNYTYRNSDYIPGKGVLDPSVSSVNSIQWRSFDDSDKHFSHVKTPFGVNNSSLSSNIFNIYGNKGTYDGSIASPFAQLNLNFGDNIYSIYNAYNGNEIIGTGFDDNTRSFETFRQYISYDYFNSSGTFGDLVNNWAYSYMRNENLYKNETCDLETLKYIIETNLIDYYIFREDTIYSNNNFQFSPISISINNPKEYKGMVTYNGWYKPKFNNILDFSYNEEKDIIDITEKDFTFSNTNLRGYKNIPQLWYHKIVERVTDYDVSAGNAIDYSMNFNPFKSQWDGDYYNIYTLGIKGSIDGYNSNLELPSYFGSKLVKLPQKLSLDSWESTTTRMDSNPQNNRLSLSYNLTRTIVNIFKNKDTFISNWADLTQSDNIIEGYIKTTTLNYYQISRSKTKVEIWRRPRIGNESPIAYTLDDTFTKWNEANIEGVLEYVNGEYIYTLDLNYSPQKTYFVKFTLFEK
jgi:hypothetical protein